MSLDVDDAELLWRGRRRWRNRRSRNGSRAHLSTSQFEVRRRREGEAALNSSGSDLRKVIKNIELYSRIINYSNTTICCQFKTKLLGLTVKSWSSLVEGDAVCIGPSGRPGYAVVFMTDPKNYAVHAWQHSIFVWLLGWSYCSSTSTKELHG